MREQLIGNVVATLGIIQTAGGYNNDIEATRIYRSLQGVPRVLNFPYLLIAIEDKPEHVLSGDVVDRVMVVTINIVCGEQGSTLAKKIETYIGDVQKAMAVDPSRGGLACLQDEPSIEEPEFSEVFQGHVSVAVVYRVVYRVSRINPNSVT